MASQFEVGVLNMFGSVNYSMMEWSNLYWWPCISILIMLGCLIGMSPLKTHQEQNFIQIIFVQIRKGILTGLLLLIFMPFIMLYLYDVTSMNQLGDSQSVWLDWFLSLAIENWYATVGAAALGLLMRFTFLRYLIPAFSKLTRKLRNTQTEDTLSDIRFESAKFKSVDFLPSKHYKKDAIFVSLDQNKQPIYIPNDTWYETNMQIIGPTRYGKGVIFGTLMDQIIRRNDALFYIDPKDDKFAAHVMYQACKTTGRKFYYLTLHDNGIGKWAPFAGGEPSDALSRLENAFGLEFTGDPGTDYYKSQELKSLSSAFRKTRSVGGLATALENSEANRVKAELSRWQAVESLSCKAGAGFSIEKALLEGAVVYVQGSLDNSVVKTATKVFIAELIQEARRLKDQRIHHLTIGIDEVSFLASKVLAQSLATAVGFRVNFCLAYQSQNDLLNLDDKTVNPKYIYQSINVNSQIKAVYGGADFETAEWASNLSGTVMKEVTKMEKTDISGTGGETWEKQRMIGTQEENLIHTNVVMSLPPRVFIFFQPRHLSTIGFSSFVPVKDMGALNSYIKHKQSSNSSDDLAGSGIALTTKSTQQKKTTKALKEENTTSNIDPNEFISDQLNTPKANSASEPKTETINSHLELRAKKLAEENNTPNNDADAEIEKKREQNRKRKEAQKQKKKAAPEPNKPKVSQAKPLPEETKVELTPPPEFSFNSDESTMNILNSLDDFDD